MLRHRDSAGAKVQRVCIFVLVILFGAVVVSSFVASVRAAENCRDDDGRRVTTSFDFLRLRWSDYYTLKYGFVYPIVTDDDLDSVVSFSSRTLDGYEVSSDDFRQADLIVYFRWADWCEDCDVLLGDISETLGASDDDSVVFVGVPYISGRKTTVDTVADKLQEYPTLVSDSSRFLTMCWEPELAASVFGVTLSEIPYLCVTTGSGAVLWRGSYSEFGTAMSLISGLGLDSGFDEYPFLGLASAVEASCVTC